MDESQIPAGGASRLQVVFLFVVGILAAPVLFAGLVGHLIERQNEIANQERERQAESLISFFVSSNEYAVYDNAVWTEAHEQLVGASNRDWFHENIGAVVAETTDFDAALVVDAAGTPQMGSWLDETGVWSPGESLGLQFATVLDTLVRSRAAPPASSFTLREGQLAFFSISEIMTTEGVTTDERRFLVFVYLFSEERMDSLRETVAWDDLILSSTKPVGAGMAIKDALGNLVYYLAWPYPRPGTQALNETMPYIVAVVLFGGIPLIGLFLRTIQANRRLEAARNAALRLAECDMLTGIANRRQLHRHLDTALAIDASFQMLMIDFDGFKEINDRFGHKFGDALLVEMTARMSRLCEGRDVIARIGGDEFAVMHFGSTDAAMELGRDLIFAISAPFETPGQTVTISASIGVAAGTDGLTGEDVLHRADLAMYDAKQHERGAVRGYEPRLDQVARSNLVLDDEMRTGLESGEFWVAYQPIYSVAEDRIVGVEALARWTHPEKGAIGPNVFIPVAETSRFIVPLGEFVLRTACMAFADPSAQGAPDDLTVSVNLSPVQLLDDLLVEKIRVVLAETGFPAERLELEITEGYLIQQEARAIEVMNSLRALGLRISLDDFGSGYASVGYLRKFPFDKIKIDRSFVSPIGTSDQARRLVAATVALCQAFDIPINAEGVETAEQAALLREMGCDLLQGYLIGRPAAELDLTCGAASRLYG